MGKLICNMEGGAVMSMGGAAGVVFEIKRFAVHDGPGVRTTVFFKGCPLRCRWCHNPEGISHAGEIAFLPRRCVGCGECVAACPKGLHSVSADGEHVYLRATATVERVAAACDLCLACVNACLPGALKFYGKEYSVGELTDAVLKDRDFYGAASSGECGGGGAVCSGGVTCSGGEPLSQAGFLAEFLAECKRRGLHTAVDTSGYAPWYAFETVAPFTDLFLYDIKHMDAQQHSALTGVPNALILANLSALSGLGAAVEVRVPVIPGFNDDAENMRRTAEFLRGVATLTAVRPLPYHALSNSKYRSIGLDADMPPATGAETERAAEFARVLTRYGLPAIAP